MTEPSMYAFVGAFGAVLVIVTALRTHEDPWVDVPLTVLVAVLAGTVATGLVVMLGMVMAWL
jgi:hypothetical protein